MQKTLGLHHGATRTIASPLDMCFSDVSTLSGAATSAEASLCDEASSQGSSPRCANEQELMTSMSHGGVWMHSSDGKLTSMDQSSNNIDAIATVESTIPKREVGPENAVQAVQADADKVVTLDDIGISLRAQGRCSPLGSNDAERSIPGMSPNFNSGVACVSPCMMKTGISKVERASPPVAIVGAGCDASSRIVRVDDGSAHVSPCMLQTGPSEIVRRSAPVCTAGTKCDASSRTPPSQACGVSATPVTGVAQIAQTWATIARPCPQPLGDASITVHTGDASARTPHGDASARVTGDASRRTPPGAALNQSPLTTTPPGDASARTPPRNASARAPGDASCRSPINSSPCRPSPWPIMSTSPCASTSIATVSSLNLNTSFLTQGSQTVQASGSPGSSCRPKGQVIMSTDPCSGTKPSVCEASERVPAKTSDTCWDGLATSCHACIGAQGMPCISPCSVAATSEVDVVSRFLEARGLRAGAELIAKLEIAALETYED